MPTPAAKRFTLRRWTARLAAAGAILAVAAQTFAAAPEPVPESRGSGRIVARCGAGFLEEIDGHAVLHVAGSPYESFEGETKDNPHQTAYENIAGSAGVAYGTRDDRLRQSMAKNLKAAHETGKAFSICQVCNQPTPKYTVLAWCWIRSLKATEILYQERNIAQRNIWEQELPHNRAVDWQPNNRVKNIRNQAWNVL